MGTDYRGKPLDEWTINRINYLYHVHEIHNQRVIAERLGVARRTVGKFLMSREQWDEQQRKSANS